VRWPGAPRPRTVLVVDGEPEPGAMVISAYRIGQPIACATGTSIDDRAVLVSACGDAAVAVVVCGAALDIERLASAGFAATPGGWWQRGRLMTQRWREGASGKLVWLGRHGCSDARAAVQGDTSSPAWIDALAPLIDAGLPIASVSLPERLLAADRSRRDVPRFTVLREAGHLRHVLVIDGVACFARRVPESGDVQAMLGDAIESLGHALDRWSLRRIDLDLGEMPAALAGTLEPALRELPVLIQMHRLPGAGVPGRTLARLAAGGATRRAESRTLQPLTRDWRLQVERRWLGRGVGLGCLAIVAIGSHTGTVGIDKARLTRQLDADAVSVLESLRRLNSEVRTLHAEPDVAMRYLEQFARLGAPPELSPEGLLSDIARAVTRHETIVLDTLAWSHRHLAAPPVPDEAVYTDAAGPALAHTADSGRVAIELSGRVLGTPSLRQAQATLTAFIVDLSVHASLQDCRSLDSPLSAAADGGAAGEGGPGADWRSRCVSGVSS